MPELPEVEAVRRALEPHLTGRTIAAGQILDPPLAAHPDPLDLERGVQGQTIASLERRGKFLLFPFVSGDQLVLHLRMTGQFSLVTPEVPAGKRRMVLHLDDGRELRFLDTRRLGQAWLLRAGEDDRYTGMDRLGPEPTDLTADAFAQKLSGRTRAIKSALMDQSVVAGIGNIYADEILFRAGIRPTRQSGSLRREEIDALVNMMPRILEDATQRGVSCSIHLFGEPITRHQPEGWRVYGKKGELCSVCGTPLVATRIGGRSTVYCPSCQI